MPAFAFVLSALIVLSVPACASYDQSPFGMNGLKLAHSRRDPDNWKNAATTANVMKEAGMYWDRLEIWWGVVEPEKGRFDWSYYDKVAEFYREQGIYGMPILCYSSAWYGKPPDNPDERARYANYVYETVNRHKDTYKVWEIWNEPNIPTFWPDPNVEQYTLMLKEAYRAAKRADPECTVLAASTSGPDLDFIKGIYKFGGWDFCDGISIHPYSMNGGPIPQKLDRILRMHQEFIKSTGKTKSLWITEMGWTTHHPEGEREQAVYLVQSYVIALANGVEKLFWFCLDDWGEKWGLVRSFQPFDPKPSYRAYKQLAAALGAPGKCAQFAGYLRMPRDTACYVFKKSDNDCVLVLWTNDIRIRTSVSFPKATRSWRVSNILGEKLSIPNPDLEVGGVPIIVTGVRPEDIGTVSKTLNPYQEKPGANMILNGSMELLNSRHEADWWNAGRFEGSAKQGQFATLRVGRNGSMCVSISKSGERAAYDQGPIPVYSGRKYRLSAWMRTENATGNNQIGLFWYSGNQWTYQGEVRSENVTGTTPWKRVEVVGVAPVGASLVRPNLISESNSGTTWFDDVELVEE